MKRSINVHASAYVDDGAKVGKGTKIWHFCHIFKGAQIGENCKIGQNVVIHSTVVIGNNVKIQNNVSLYDGVTLGDDVFCGPSCVFTNILNPRAGINRNDPKFYRPTFVAKGVTIGANSTILCGISIGTYAFIGAGAVVTRDIPDYALVYGSPARQKGWVCECGIKIKKFKAEFLCAACGAAYKNYKGSMSRVQQ